MEEMEFQAFSVRLPVALHQEARIKSVKTGKSLNEVIVEKITEWVNEPAKPAAQPAKKGGK